MQTEQLVQRQNPGKFLLIILTEVIVGGTIIGLLGGFILLRQTSETKAPTTNTDYIKYVANARTAGEVYFTGIGQQMKIGESVVLMYDGLSGYTSFTHPSVLFCVNSADGRVIRFYLAPVPGSEKTVFYGDIESLSFKIHVLRASALEIEYVVVQIPTEAQK